MRNQEYGEPEISRVLTCEVSPLGMLPNASSCAQHTVRPSNTEMLEFGTENSCLLQGHARRTDGSCPQTPELPKGFQQSIFKGQVREGHGWL